MSTSPRPRRVTRPLTSTELIRSATSLYRRLRAATDAFDADPKSDLGVPNMAAPLRALVCPGSGNEVLQRLCAEGGLDLPSVEVSYTGTPNHWDTVWTGNVPMESKQDASTNSVALDVWLDSTCLAVDHEHERIILRWKFFIPGIAEKRGYLHADASVPAYFATVDSVQLMGHPMSDWLYRKAAGAVGRAAHEVLIACSVTDVPGSPTYDQPGGSVGGGAMFRGIFEATATQAAYEKKLNDALADATAGRVDAALAALSKLSAEVESFETLFYRRVRAKMALELGNIEARRNRRGEAEKHWKKLIDDYWRSEDTFLRGAAEKALSNYSGLWR